jgi:hypothetical protein
VASDAVTCRLRQPDSRDGLFVHIAGAALKLHRGVDAAGADIKGMQNRTCGEIRASSSIWAPDPTGSRRYHALAVTSDDGSALRRSRGQALRDRMLSVGDRVRFLVSSIYHVEQISLHPSKRTYRSLQILARYAAHYLGLRFLDALPDLLDETRALRRQKHPFQPPIDPIWPSFNKAHSLKPVDEAAKRHFAKIEFVSERNLGHPVVTGKEGQHPPLRPCNVEWLQNPIDDIAAHARDVVNKKAKAQFPVQVVRHFKILVMPAGGPSARLTYDH